LREGSTVFVVIESGLMLGCSALGVVELCSGHGFVQSVAIWQAGAVHFVRMRGGGDAVECVVIV
jgi:hypothetical protein